MRNPIARDAFLFGLYTGMRRDEVLGLRWAQGADWSEFELDGLAPVWTVPAARMKMNRKHSFPLSAEIVAMLRNHAEAIGAHMAGGPVFSFPRKPNGTISNDMGRAMRERGGLCDARFADRETGEAPTVHGFRNAFADLVR